MTATNMQDFVRHHPFGVDALPPDMQQVDHTSNVLDYLTEKIFIEDMCACGYTAEEIVPVLREYDRQLMEPILVSIGDDEEGQA